VPRNGHTRRRRRITAPTTHKRTQPPTAHNPRNPTTTENGQVRLQTTTSAHPQRPLVPVNVHRITAHPQHSRTTTSVRKRRQRPHHWHTLLTTATTTTRNRRAPPATSSHARQRVAVSLPSLASNKRPIPT
jgi:hypothetical protein